MNNRIKDFLANFSFDKSSIPKVILLFLLIVFYASFLILQRVLYVFSEIKTRLIMINILLTIGVLFEIGSFFWNAYKKEEIENEETNKS